MPESVGISSEGPIGNESAQNTAQAGKEKSNHLMEALKSVQSMYEPTGGIPLAGSEDIRVKRDVYGRPYTTVNVSARDSSGQFKERTEYDLSGKPVTTRGDISEGMGKIDRSKEQPVTFANPAQAAEVERRKQMAMAGKYGVM
jgi:hypothetical protein